MNKSVISIVLSLLLISSATARCRTNFQENRRTAKEERGLLGPVLTVRYEWCVLTSQPNKSGEHKEKEHIYVETLTFDVDGHLTMNEPNDLCGGFAIGASNQHVLRYDEKGNVIEDTTYSTDGVKLGRVTKSYDAAGKVLELASYGQDGLMEYKWINKYDDQGRDTEAGRYSRNGYLQWKDVYVRDETGRLIEHSYYTKGGSRETKERFDYEYDRYGNWVKRTTKEYVAKGSGSYYKPTRVDYRIISYY